MAGVLEEAGASVTEQLQPVEEIAQTIVAGGAFTDEDAVRVAEALLARLEAE